MAQDKAIGGAYRKGGYGKATQYGVRTGAGAGALIGSLLSNNALDTPGNELQTPYKKPIPIKTGKSYQTRLRRTGRYSRRCYPERNTRRYNRYSNSSRY